MKTACTLILCLVASLQFSPASAQVYQWKDSSGRTVISDSPPPSGAKGSRTISTAPAAGSAPKAAAEKDMDFRKRRQDARQKAEDDAKEQTATAERKENCEQAKIELSTLESGERLMVRDEKGDKRFMEDAQRQQEMERTRRIIAESCK
ncbi:MAG TPA: DUF4124 domain-containing protein [Rhodocyclaceae bacterium]|nr:DUF4124 domain-containing protein [Rhodocyclaceae bacterium]